MSDELRDRLRALPAVDRLAGALDGPRSVCIAVARHTIDLLRAELRAGAATPSFDDAVARAKEVLEDEQRARLRTVINATGVLIHTNLGRVPLGRPQLDALNEIASGYSNLEYDLTRGTRGSRYSHAARLINTLTGSEAALVVNNNAAAVMLTLAALCSGREVIISRGELIEIGGEFRIPEVMEMSGTRLVEVGTTNRTHLADYERAVTEDTAAILKVHPSNYRVVGFASSVSARDLALLARGRGLPFIHDLGSGFITPQGAELPWTAAEPPVDAALAEGAGVVTFSGDKLLGGPQAGVIAGRAELLDAISRHPLLRALRVDKMTLAALEATLEAHLEGRVTDLPVWSMALADVGELRNRAEALASRIEEAVSGVKAEAVAASSVTGGGSLPGEELSSWAVALTHDERSSDELARTLHYSTTPVIARIEDDRVLLDLRSVPPSQDDTLFALVSATLS